MSEVTGGHVGTEMLSAHLDGRLEADERERLESHLSACPRCGQELEAMRSAVAAVRALPQVRAPRSFALTPEQVRPRRRGSLFAGISPRLFSGPVGALRMGGAVAVLLLAALLIVDLGNVTDGTAGGDASQGIAASTEAQTDGAPVGGGAAASGRDTKEGAASPGTLEDRTSQQQYSEPEAGGSEDGEAAPVSDEAGEPAARDPGGDALRRAEIAVAAAAVGLLAAALLLGRRRRA